MQWRVSTVKCLPHWLAIDHDAIFGALNVIEGTESAQSLFQLAEPIRKNACGFICIFR